jgi:2-furoyl-CoA dehydrogenase FAD binding subunit
MKPVAFDYYRPETIAEALALLAELRDEAAVLAGGLTLGPLLNMRLARPRAVIDIVRLQALKGIAAGSNLVTTGAGVAQFEAIRSAAIARGVPLLAKGLPWVGHFQTRNRGTLGGSVAHADPSAEIPLCLVACNGWVVLQSRRRQRRVPARDYFLGALATARQADELITALEWPRTAADAGCAFSEIARRHGDFAVASAACVLRLGADGRIGDLSVGLGGVEGRPVAADTRAFIGRIAEDAGTDLADHAAAQITAMEDHVATADHRRALARVLVERVYNEALAEAGQRGRPRP